MSLEEDNPVAERKQSGGAISARATSRDAFLHPSATLQFEDSGAHRVYKRRFFGLAQLVLLNVVVSWDVREILLLHGFCAGLGRADRMDAWCSSIVAHIFRRIDDCIGVFQGLRWRDQLDEHWFPLRILCSKPVSTSCLQKATVGRHATKPAQVR
jgi:hypothetical protein